jgi:hypothetical protein
LLNHRASQAAKFLSQCPESPFQIWSQWAEILTNCELLNEKPRLDGHPDGARGPSIGATEGAPNGFVSRAFGRTLMALTIYPECVLPASWHINGPTASAYPLAGAVSLAGAAPFTFHHTGRKLSSESDSAMFNPRIFGRWSDAPKLFWCIGDTAI